MRSRSVLIGVLAVVIGFAALVLASENASTVPNHFEWVSYDTGIRKLDRAAMVVPVYFKGSHQKLYAQLDTGSDATIFYGDNLRQWGIDIDSAKNPPIEMSWTGNLDLQPISSLVAWVSDLEPIDTTSVKLEDRIVGTIGADQLSGKILVLDFPNQSYSVLTDTNQIPENIKSSVEYVRTVLHDGRLWVKVIVGVDTLGWALYDTGSSETCLGLPLKEWQRMTKHIGDEADVARDSVPAWGEYQQMLSVRVKTELRLGSVTIEDPLIQYGGFSDTALGEWRILGNAAFYNDYIVIYDAKYNRFGLALAKK